MGAVADDPRDRQVPRRSHRHAHGAGSVDSVTQIQLTRALVDIDSTTGCEGEAGRFIADTLRNLGYKVPEQPVSAGRFNVIALVGEPVVVFSTHFDCVPPFFPSSMRDN